MKINTFYPTQNGYIIETDNDTFKLENVTSQMLGFIQESYNEYQTEQLVNNILESQYEFNFNPSKARAFNNVKSTSLVLEDAIIEYEPKVSQKVLEQTNLLFSKGAIASGLYVLNKVSAPVSFNGKISEQQEIQFKTDCTTLSSKNMLYTTRKLPLANRILEDEFIYENKGRIYRIPLQYIKEDADEVEVAIREDFNIYVKPTYESLYGHRVTRKSDHILEVETLNHGKYIIESEETLPEQDDTFLMKVTESLTNSKVTKIALTEAEMFTTPGGHPVVITNVTAMNETTLLVEYYRQAGDAYKQQVQLGPEVLQEISIEKYIDTLLPYIARIEKQPDFDKSAELSQEVLDVLAQDSIKIFRQQRIGKIVVDKNTIDKREDGRIIIDVDVNPSKAGDYGSAPKDNEMVATTADQNGDILIITYRVNQDILDEMGIEDFVSYYQKQVDKVAGVQTHYSKALALSKEIFRKLSQEAKWVSSQPDKTDKLVYVEEDEDIFTGCIEIGDFKLCPPISTQSIEEDEGTQVSDVPSKTDFFKSLILPNFQNVTEEVEPQPRKLTPEQYKKEFGEADIEVINAGREPQDRVEIITESIKCDMCGAEGITGQYCIKNYNVCNDCAKKHSLKEIEDKLNIKESDILDKQLLKEEKNKIEEERWSILNEISKGNATYEEYVEQLDNLDERIDEIDAQLNKVTEANKDRVIFNEDIKVLSEVISSALGKATQKFAPSMMEVKGKGLIRNGKNYKVKVLFKKPNTDLITVCDFIKGILTSQLSTERFKNISVTPEQDNIIVIVEGNGLSARDKESAINAEYHVVESEKKILITYRAYPDEFDSRSDVWDLADTVQSIYDEEGMEGVNNWFLPGVDEKYRKLVKALIIK